MEPIRLECDWTVDDFMEGTELYRKQTWTRRHGRHILLTVIFLGYLVVFFRNSAIFGESFEVAGFALLIFTVVFWSFITFSNWLQKKLHRRIYAKEALRRKSMSFVVSPDNLRMTTPDSDATVKWSMFTDWAEGPNLFVLFQHRLMYLFPKRRLSEIQQNALRELIVEKLAGLPSNRAVTN